MEATQTPWNLGFDVGSWRARPDLNQLDGERGPIRIEPKVMAVLVHLATHAGKVVGRDELLDAVWRSRHVSEDLPRRAIYELRKAFGDNPRHPTYIQTIPRAGYRLLATVTPLAADAGESDPRDTPASTSTVAPPPDPHASRRHPLTRYVAFTGVVVLGAAILSAGFLRDPRKTTPAQPQLSPLTTLPGLEFDPAFSPDSSRVAFLASSSTTLEGEMALHVQLVGDTSSLRITDEPADWDHPIESPAWSPDGTRIAYLRWRAGEGWSLCEVPALGGVERKLVALGRAGASGLTWSPDGRRMALGLRLVPGQPLALHQFSLDTGTLEPLTHPPATTVGDQLPAWSPSGDHIAFIRTVATDASELHVVAASGGDSRSLLAKRHKIADLDWAAEGTHLAVAVHEAGHHRIWRVDVATGEARALNTLGDHTRYLSVARREDQLVYARTRFAFGVRRLDLKSGEVTSLPTLSSTFYDDGLALSPDGRRLALVSTRSGAVEIWICDIEGKRPQRLTSFQGPRVGHPRWLANGQALVFQAEVDGIYDLWTINADGSGQRRLTQSAHDDRVPSPSRDGLTIFFASDRSGVWQVWRRPLAGGAAMPVTRDGGYLAQPSPDGEWLYYTRWRTDGLWRVATGGGDEVQILGDVLRQWESENWAVTEEGIYFITRGEDDRVELALFAFDEERIVRRLPLHASQIQPSLAFAPDGTTALFAQLERVDSDLVLVSDWDQ